MGGGESALRKYADKKARKQHLLSITNTLELLSAKICHNNSERKVNFVVTLYISILAFEN